MHPAVDDITATERVVNESLRLHIWLLTSSLQVYNITMSFKPGAMLTKRVNKL